MRFLFLATVFASMAAAQQPPQPKASLSLQTKADYLALHLTGKAPTDTSALEYRLAETGSAEALPWVPMPANLMPEGAFQYDLPLPTSRWAELQVRALKDGVEIAQRKTRAEEHPLELLTP